MDIRPKEDHEQRVVILYLRSQKIFHHANVNENQGSFLNKKVSAIQEAKAQKMGKVKGIPDITIFLPHRILYIEMKRKQIKLQNGSLSNRDSKPSKEQIINMAEINKYPYALAKVCYGADEAIKYIKTIIEYDKKNLK